MSTRTTPAMGHPNANRPRLEEVLAAGLVLSRKPNVPVGVPPAQPNPYGNPAPPPELLDRLTALPPDLLETVVKSGTGMSCKEIARLCGLNSAFRALCQSEAYWEWQSNRQGYNIFMNVRLVGQNGQAPDGGSRQRMVATAAAVAVGQRAAVPAVVRVRVRLGLGFARAVSRTVHRTAHGRLLRHTNGRVRGRQRGGIVCGGVLRSVVGGRRRGGGSTSALALSRWEPGGLPSTRTRGRWWRCSH